MITGIRAVLCVYRNHHVDLYPCFCFLWACGCRLGLHYVLFVDFWVVFILLALGITGEYIAKIYMEVKARPRYIIETTI